VRFEETVSNDLMFSTTLTADLFGRVLPITPICEFRILIYNKIETR
jgi:hypothetical protein